MAMAFLFVALPARADSFSGTGNPTLTTGDAPDSICPSGWRLARYSGSGSYNGLVQDYLSRGGSNQRATNIDTLFLNAPISYLRSGQYLNYQSQYGSIWASRSISASNCGLLLGSSELCFQGSASRGSGFSLRCLAR